MPPQPGSALLPYLPARSQGSSKECTAYAAVAAMESWVLYHQPGADGFLPLVESDLFRMVPEPRHSVRNALKVARDFGIVEQGASAQRAGLRPRQRRERPDLFWRLDYAAVRDAPTPDRKQLFMMKALEQGHPLVTSIYVDDGFFGYGSGVYRPVKKPLPQAHAICIIGYDAERGFWIAKNSMGSGWGVDGGCFAFPFGETVMGAEDLVWEVGNVILPAF